MRTRTITLLNRALATELISVFRYQRHASLAADAYGARTGERLLQHADEQSAHVEHLARRIVELGGVPDFRIGTLPVRTFVDYLPALTLQEDDFLPALLDADLLAEEIAADAYREIIEGLGDSDSATCSMLARIIAASERHAAELEALVDGERPPGSHGPFRLANLAFQSTTGGAPSLR